MWGVVGVDGAIDVTELDEWFVFGAYEANVENLWVMMWHSNSTP
jgi:hypothetical protein